mgnify:CR=1 FL=1
MPFQKILVPVDGSELGDQILTQVQRLLHVQDAQVLLLRVVPPVSGEAARAQQERFDAAKAHVERLRDHLGEQGVEVRTLVLRGDPAEVILQCVESQRPALVAMATHGRSGPSRWVRGSVAERVLRGCAAPLLLANPRALGQEVAQELRFKRIMVPLDGSQQAESILPTVIELARFYGAEVTLLRVGWLAPAAMDYPVHAAIPPVTPEELEATLEMPRTRIAAAGVPVKTAVTFGFEADEILAAVEREPGTLLAMTTHGRTGLDRWLFGSVAEKVLRACTCPVLVKRVAAFTGEGERVELQVPAGARS